MENQGDMLFGWNTNQLPVGSLPVSVACGNTDKASPISDCSKLGLTKSFSASITSLSQKEGASAGLLAPNTKALIPHYLTLRRAPGTEHLRAHTWVPSWFDYSRAT